MPSSPTEPRWDEIAPPHLFRRILHLASPAFLVYYVLPEDLGFGLTRLSVTILVFGTAMAIEVVRVALRIPLFGLRGYETGRLSAYAWGSLGLLTGLLYFPPQFVIPVFCGMAWIDPLCSWSRQRGTYPALPALAYAALFLAFLAAFRFPSPAIAILTAIATASALLAEYPRIEVIDDDFLMTVVPLLTTAAAASLLQNL